jgi:hypothetical protein
MPGFPDPLTPFPTGGLGGIFHCDALELPSPLVGLGVGAKSVTSLKWDAGGTRYIASETPGMASRRSPSTRREPMHDHGRTDREASLRQYDALRTSAESPDRAGVRGKADVDPA